MFCISGDTSKRPAASSFPLSRLLKRKHSLTVTTRPHFHNVTMLKMLQILRNLYMFCEKSLRSFSFPAIIWLFRRLRWPRYHSVRNVSLIHHLIHPDPVGNPVHGYYPLLPLPQVAKLGESWSPTLPSGWTLLQIFKKFLSPSFNLSSVSNICRARGTSTN